MELNMRCSTHRSLATSTQLPAAMPRLAGFSFRKAALDAQPAARCRRSLHCKAQSGNEPATLLRVFGVDRASTPDYEAVSASFHMFLKDCFASVGAGVVASQLCSACGMDSAVSEHVAVLLPAAFLSRSVYQLGRELAVIAHVNEYSPADRRQILGRSVIAKPSSNLSWWYPSKLLVAHADEELQQLRIQLLLKDATIMHLSKNLKDDYNTGAL